MPRHGEASYRKNQVARLVYEVGPLFWPLQGRTGEILHMHIGDEFIDLDKMYVDTPALNLIGRMHGGGWYARTTDLFEMSRIPLDEWDASKGDAE